MKVNKTKSAVFLFSVVFMVFAFVTGVPAPAQEVDEAVKAQVDAAKAQVEAAVKAQAETAVKAQVDAAKAQVETAVKAQVETAVKAQLDTAVKTQVEAAVKAQAEAAVRTQVAEAVKAQTDAGVRTQVEEAVKAQVEAVVKAQVDAVVKPQVEAAARTQVDSARAEVEDIVKTQTVAAKAEVEKAVKDFAKEYQKILIAALIAVTVFIMLAPVLLSVLLIKKTAKRNKKWFDGAISRFNTLEDDVDKIKTFENRINNQKTPLVVDHAERDEIESIKHIISELKNTVRDCKAGMEDLKREQLRTRQEQQDIKEGKLDPLTVFNRWAENPSSNNLPVSFYYINGEPRIRTSQRFSETQMPAKWIKNRDGSTMYLLPNPNFFDSMTDITDLYKMDLNALKPKGQNRIKIIEPCKISDTGFIEFPGELRIL